MNLLRSWQPRIGLSRRPLTRQHAVLIPLDPYPLVCWDIKDILAMLHVMYPALDYPLYEGVLHMHGINELTDTLWFSTYCYAEMVGMHYGAAYIFCKWVLEDGRKLYHTQISYTTQWWNSIHYFCALQLSPKFIFCFPQQWQDHLAISIKIIVTPWSFCNVFYIKSGCDCTDPNLLLQVGTCFLCFWLTVFWCASACSFCCFLTSPPDSLSLALFCNIWSASLRHNCSVLIHHPNLWIAANFVLLLLMYNFFIHCHSRLISSRFIFILN